MPDIDTRRRIDTARDILVGKVPDPKSQVEQITIALIYKFMDDMDAESEEIGGIRKFFAGEFARYGWAKLMRSGLGGYETLNLYAEAIAKMPENPGIPLLFRDIFKNAYLPYRDPETLKMFLKVIDEFTYDHSERLGDAFEYLLSVMGSQGDAGQFRTPRHIIDFMVEVIDPKKTETVLDPACGTAGFLISSYRHILKANTDGQGNSTLTPDEKGHLAQNFKGYDISPDMVRLSLVNMYLHGFADPHIAEYDTLTNLDKWNEYADVILANPPFMSPKGGIQPHNRFSVQSKRSEVLFVDYMAEHLTPTGRAGIIVPEGIVFQSGSAYTQLRRMLVEEYLIAVVSLPSGVFNPYSGVKTSILVLDKTLARKTNTLAFFKVENDGLGLGAQRREIDKNDLPQVKAEITEYFRRIRAGVTVADFRPLLGIIVEKAKVAANGDYFLNGERYRDGMVNLSTFPLVELGEICELVRGVVYTKEDEVSEGGVKVLRANNINKDRYELNLDDIKYVSPKVDFPDEKKLKRNDIFICLASGSKDHIGKVALIKEDTDFYFGGFMGVIRVKPGRLTAGYLLKLLTTGHFNNYLRKQIAGANINNLSTGLLYKFAIPLPPLEFQKEIVAEIEGYQKVVDGARLVIDNCRPRIPIQPNWPMVELGKVFSRSEQSVFPETLTGPVIYIGLENISQGTGEIIGNILKEDPVEIKSIKNVFKRNDILYGKLRPNLNKVWLADRDGICSTDIFVIQPLSDQVIPAFYTPIFLSETFNQSVMLQIKGAQLPRVGWSSFASLNIPFPPLATQQRIVSEIETDQTLVTANRELISRFNKKIQATLERVWGENEPAQTGE